MHKTCTIADLVPRITAYQKGKKPATGYAVRAAEAVVAAYKAGQLPEGTNIAVQFALQFDGKETGGDLVRWDKPEWRLPYSNTYRYNLDQSVDCSSFWYSILKALFGINIGTTTLNMHRLHHKAHRVPWEQSRPLDMVMYAFKAGRPVSHVAGYIGGGKILHTTSPGNAMRVEADSYSASKRVAVYRVLSDEQYNSLIIGGVIPQPIQEGGAGIMWQKGDNDKPVYKGVAAWQQMIADLGFEAELGGKGVDGDFGSKTEAGTRAAQKLLGLPQTGVADNVTVGRAAAYISLHSVSAKEYTALQLENGRLRAADAAKGAVIKAIQAEANKIKV